MMMGGAAAILDAFMTAIATSANGPEASRFGPRKAVKDGGGVWIIWKTLHFDNSNYTRINYSVNITRVISAGDRPACLALPIANLAARCYDSQLPMIAKIFGGIAMLTVHHLNNSRSQRVLWLLEELGLPYEIVRYQRQPDMRAPAELRAIHPLGKSPVITDNGNTIAESGAIAEYIIDSYGEGRLIPPPKTPERLRYSYWLHYAEGSAMPPLLLKLLFTLMPKRAPALLRPLVRKVSNQALTKLVNPQLKQHMAYWESELGKSEWFAGNEFTAADIQMSFPLEAAAARGGLEQGHPRAMAFLDRIHARPAYKRALEKGGPYTVGR
jgi:glutathione S-transferase